MCLYVAFALKVLQQENFYGKKLWTFFSSCLLGSLCNGLIIWLWYLTAFGSSSFSYHYV